VLLFEHQFPFRLSIQASKVAVHDENLPLQREFQRCHLSGHPQGSMEPSFDNFESASFHIVIVDGLQPKRSFGSRDCAALLEGQGKA